MALDNSIKLTGDKELLEKLKRAGPLAFDIGAASLYRSGQIIMGISQEQFCPVETGTLRSTGRVEAPERDARGVSVTLGYGGPAAKYAIKVHENPRAGKTGGRSPSGAKYKRWAKTGQWKYLETPVKQNAKNVVEDLKVTFDRALSGL